MWTKNGRIVLCVRVQIHFNDRIHAPVMGQGLQPGAYILGAVIDYCIRAGSLGVPRLCITTDGREDPRAARLRELDRVVADSTSATGNHDRDPRARLHNLHRMYGGERGDPQTRTFGVTNVGWKGHCLSARQSYVFRCRAERPLPLPVPHPHALTDSARGHVRADSIDFSGSLPVRNPKPGWVPA